MAGSSDGGRFVGFVATSGDGEGYSEGLTMLLESLANNFWTQSHVVQLEIYSLG